jgi:hypothetical protein
VKQDVKQPVPPALMGFALAVREFALKEPPPIPHAYQGIIDSIARSMRERPEMYAHLKASPKPKKKVKG